MGNDGGHLTSVKIAYARIWKLYSTPSRAEEFNLALRAWNNPENRIIPTRPETRGVKAKCIGSFVDVMCNNELACNGIV